MRYREHPPSAGLAPFVECIWTLGGHAGELGGELQPVLPDGRPEMIVHFGDPFDRVEPDVPAERQPGLIFAGQLGRRLVLGPTGRIATLGVRFRPHGAAAFVDAPQHELSGATLPIDVVDRRLAAAALRVRETCASAEEAVAAIDRELARLARGAPVDLRVATAVHSIARSGGTVPVELLAHRLNLTRRQLERLFATAVGLSPKRLARLTRFQRAIRLLESDHGGPRGIRTAHACGYADQAHFIRDFQALAGCAPGAHLLARAEITAFFTGTSR